MRWLVICCALTMLVLVVSCGPRRRRPVELPKAVKGPVPPEVKGLPEDGLKPK